MTAMIGATAVAAVAPIPPWPESPSSADRNGPGAAHRRPPPCRGFGGTARCDARCAQRIGPGERTSQLERNIMVRSGRFFLSTPLTRESHYWRTAPRACIE